MSGHGSAPIRKGKICICPDIDLGSTSPVWSNIHLKIGKKSVHLLSYSIIVRSAITLLFRWLLASYATSKISSNEYSPQTTGDLSSFVR